MNVDALREQILRASRPGGHPVNAPHPVILGKDAAALALSHGLPLADVEIAALEAGVIPARYLRNMDSLGLEDQIRLLKSHAVIVGLGGLGGYASQILARLGVGSLLLIDGDLFEETNLNRQAACTRQTLGGSKTQTAAQAIGEINPSVRVRFEKRFLDKDNAPELLQGAQAALDCLGGLDNRVVLQKAAQGMGIPLVSAAVAGFSGHVTSIFPGSQGVFPLLGQEESSQGGGVELDLGCPCPAVSFAASVQCSEAVKILTGKGRPLQDRLLAFDLSDNTFQVYSLA